MHFYPFFNHQNSRNSYQTVIHCQLSTLIIILVIMLAISSVVTFCVYKKIDEPMGLFKLYMVFSAFALSLMLQVCIIGLVTTIINSIVIV